jgi:hypothetical protein
MRKNNSQSLPATTTAQEDVVTAGQRTINKIWEITQAIIAVSITAAKIYTAVYQIKSEDLTNAFFLVVSMYLVRTNHQLIGGIGHKPANQSR